MHKRLVSALCSSLFLVTVLTGCKKAPQAPPAATVPSVIAAYTSGVVSRETVVKVQFTDMVVAPEQVGTALDTSPFVTDPKIAGTTLWSDRQTLELRPAAPLTPGDVYTIELPIEPLVKVTEGDRLLRFGFTIMQQSLSVRHDGLAAGTDGSTQTYSGNVSTADVSEAADVEKVLDAKLEGKAQSISWTHGEDRREHGFVVSGITRGDQERTLIIAWDGSAIGADAKGEEKVAIPATSTFGVVQVRPLQGEQQGIEVRFSDPLQGKQNLNGLVRAGTGNVRLQIEGSIVRVYGETAFGDTVELVVEPGVKSQRGAALKQRYVETVTFAPLAPTVRFASKGVFVPSTDGLTIPIEAANLKAIVVEATRVPEQSIPQFLQVNSLDTANEMQRVGRVVWKQLIELKEGALQPNRWLRYGLDVKPLLAKHPTGLYRLKLSFQRQHIVYNCAQAAPADAVTDLSAHDDDWGQSRDQSYWDMAEDMGGESDWYERRNDPCHRAFYAEYGDHTISATRNVIVTDIGLIAKVGNDSSVFVAANDLRTAKALSGVDIELLDYQQQSLVKGSTNSEGTVRLSVDHRPFVVIAKSGDQRGYLKLDDGAALTTAHFDVSGAAVNRGIKGKIYGERGIWRPGDDIYLTFVLHDPDDRIPADHPIRFELVDPRGRVVDTQIRREGVDGFYAFRTKTAPEAPTGNYLARVHVGGTGFEEPVKVEMVRPNRLKIGFDLTSDLLQSGQAIDAKLSSTWLHGAIARFLQADVNVSLSKRATTFKAYPEYTFDDPLRRFDTESQSIFTGNLDDQGETRVRAKLSAQGQAPGMLTANFTTRVFESSGVYSADSFSVPFSPYNRYIGIKPPKGDAARGMLLTDTQHALALVAVKPDGTLVNKDVTVECKLYQVQWRWWWEKGEDTSFADYVESAEHQAVASGNVVLKNGQGSWTFELRYPSWGRYLLVARDLKGGHRAGKIVYMDWPGWAGRAQKDGAGGASVLTFTADKGEYSVGDTVQLSIPAPESGRGLVSIESGTKVVQADWIQAKGSNTRYSFKATAEMAPNVYVHVTMVQPHMQVKNDLPIRLYGVVPIKVTNPETKLSPVVTAPDVFAPESNAQVVVRESQGRAMTYTLAMVDEGLLGLTRFQTPSLWDHFYRREALGVRTWDVYDLVAGAYGASLERMLAVGGDDEAADSGGQKANRFPPLVRFYGPYTLAKGDTGTHTVEVPRYVGAVRLMVVAGHAGAFGSAEKSVFVRRPLMLLATLPRVLGPEEEVDLPVTVFALEEKVKKAKLKVRVSGPLAVVGDAARDLTFSSVGDETVAFRVKAKPQPGVVKVEITAEGSGEKAAQNIEIAVRMPGVRVTNVVAGAVEPDQSTTTSLELPGFAGTNTAMLEVSRIPPLDLGRRLEHLVHYPYGCLEQTTSSVFPQLYLNVLLDLPASRKAEIENNVRAGVDRLRLFQTPSGGFSYWPGETALNDWASSYAGHFLAEAKRAGYLVPDVMLDQWKRYQRNRANAFTASPERHNSALDQAYRLYTLALAGAPELGAMNRLKESGKLEVAALWQLAAAYQLAGKPEVARELTKATALSVPRYRELSYTYGSDLRDRAIILDTLGLMGDYARGMPLAKEISATLTQPDGWMSTQEIAHSLAAMARFFNGNKNKDTARFAYALASGASKEVELKSAIAQESLSIGKSDQVTVKVTNAGKTPLFIRLIGSGLPKYGTERDSENGLSTKVTYTTLSGEDLDPVELDQGTDFVAQVTVKNTSGRGLLENLALSQLVASGWEIRNQRVETGAATTAAVYDYQDVRDDRVLTYFSLKANEERAFKVLLNASYTGRFYLPLIAAEAMYDGAVNGRVAGQWVTVKRAGSEVTQSE